VIDPLTHEERSRIMSRVRSQDTKPEIVVRRQVHATGMRFRLHRRDLPGRPDLVLPRHRVAVFVNGCFCHGCPICDQGSRQPKGSADFWAEKPATNRARDATVTRQLEEARWRVVLIWECQARRPSHLERALVPVLELARRNR
jgi:DNA mismatch endonuclease (patch repair protein)